MRRQVNRQEPGDSRRFHSRTGLFMMELILAILFFSIGAACCLQMFVKASDISREAEDLKAAVGTAENLVQLLKAGALEGLAEEAPGGTGKEYLFYYDRKGDVCGRETADYQASVSVKKESRLTAVTIDCARLEGQEIYSLSTAFVPEVYE